MTWETDCEAAWKRIKELEKALEGCQEVIKEGLAQEDLYREALEGIRKMCADQYSEADDHYVDVYWVIDRCDKALRDA